MVLLIMLSAILLPEIEVEIFFEWKKHLIQEIKMNQNDLIKKNIKNSEDRLKVKKLCSLMFEMIEISQSDRPSTNQIIETIYKITQKKNKY